MPRAICWSSALCLFHLSLKIQYAQDTLCSLLMMISSKLRHKTRPCGPKYRSPVLSCVKSPPLPGNFSLCVCLYHVYVITIWLSCSFHFMRRLIVATNLISCKHRQEIMIHFISPLLQKQSSMAPALWSVQNGVDCHRLLYQVDQKLIDLSLTLTAIFQQYIICWTDPWW